MKKYNSWPLGQIPKELQRSELEQIKQLGYNWNDPRDVIDIFEKKVAAFAGSKYAIGVDCCSNGIFLCLKFLNASGVISIPRNTYISIPMQIQHAGCKVKFENVTWSGIYQLYPFSIYDGATRWGKNMYVGINALQVVSFQLKKRIPIGKGGMILTDREDAYNWLRLARHDGRDMDLPYDHPEHIKMRGWHMNMIPEDAARGIILMDSITEEGDSGNNTMYPDCQEMMKNL